MARAVTLSVPDLATLTPVLRGGPGPAGGGGRRAASSRARGAVGPGRGEARARVPVGRRLPGRAGLVLGSAPGAPGPRATGSATWGSSTSRSAFATAPEFEAACRRCARGRGARATARRSASERGRLSTSTIDQGFSVELLHVEPWYEGQMGFRPRPTPRLAPFAGGTPARRLRPASRFGKAIVTGAAGGIGTELARLAAEDGTSLVLMDREGERAVGARGGARRSG